MRSYFALSDRACACFSHYLRRPVSIALLNSERFEYFFCVSLRDRSGWGFAAKFGLVGLGKGLSDGPEGLRIDLGGVFHGFWLTFGGI